MTQELSAGQYEKTIGANQPPTARDNASLLLPPTIPYRMQAGKWGLALLVHSSASNPFPAAGGRQRGAGICPLSYTNSRNGTHANCPIPRPASLADSFDGACAVP